MVAISPTDPTSRRRFICTRGRLRRKGTTTRQHGVPHAALRAILVDVVVQMPLKRRENGKLDEKGREKERARGELTRLVAERPTIKVSEGEREACSAHKG